MGLNTAALCLGTYDDPMGVGVSYERATPAAFVPAVLPTVWSVLPAAWVLWIMVRGGAYCGVVGICTGVLCS